MCGEYLRPSSDFYRWYCNVCGAGYKTSYGVVCEFARGADKPVLWCRATVPDNPFKDIKFLAVQERHPDAKTPQALLEELDVARPLDKGRFMRQAYGRGAWKFPEHHTGPNREKPLDGTYKFDVSLLESLGEPLRWGSLFEAIRQCA